MRTALFLILLTLTGCEAVAIATDSISALTVISDALSAHADIDNNPK